MIYFLVIIASTVMNMTFLVDSFDFNNHNRHIQYVEYVAEEVAAASVQIFDVDEYSDGRKVFNYPEAIDYANHILASNLNADVGTVSGTWDYDNRLYTATIEPKGKNYITETIRYTITFYDDSNTTFPVLHTQGNFVHAIGDPTAVVIINTGKPKYRGLFTPPNTVVGAAHTWQAR